MIIVPNIKGRGYDFAISRITEHLHKYYRHHGCDGYVLMIDFSKFFDRIQHDKLYNILDSKFTNERIKNLYRLFIDAFGDVGLGLGSQISQISALAYPNRIDHIIKENLRIKYYGRYMDDSYLIHHSKEYLHHCLQVITEECNKLGIILNTKKTQIIKLSHGFTFLKIKFNLTETGKVIKRPSSKCITKMRIKMKKFRIKVDNGDMSILDVLISHNSGTGHIGRCNSYATLQSINNLFYKLFA